MKKANICGKRFVEIYKHWATMYHYTIRALHELGYEINMSPLLTISDLPDYVSVGIVDAKEDVYVYNHTFIESIERQGIYSLGKKKLFLKPTAPSLECFTLDSMGYAATSSITYNKPDFENYDSRHFFETKAARILKKRSHKWQDREDLQFLNKPIDTPKDHVLVIGQMPADETVTEMSFGDHWSKFKAIIENLKTKQHPLVVKVHPTLLPRQKEEVKNIYLNDIEKWISEGIDVFYGFESLYDILPNTKVAIIENSTAGIDCLIQQVPIISYGYPEYHWATKDLRHLNMLDSYINDMSWYDRDLANSWIAWYCEQYQCYDYESTLKRVKEILNES